MGNTGINFLEKYTFYVIDIFKEDKYSDIYDPNVQSGRVLRQPDMNTFDDKVVIIQDLKMYLKVIEDRDLSKIEGVQYTIKKSNLTTFFIKTAVFLLK